MKKRGRSRVGLIFILSLSLLLFASFIVKADEARYIYDDLGRLYQVIDELGNVATYNYDAVGNLLSIIRSTGGLPAPEITGISPSVANPGDTVQVTISGKNFLNAGVSTDNPGINIGNLQTTETSITATFSISFFSPVGLTTVIVSNALGSAKIGFTVNPQPIIDALSPPYGPVSRLVTISGTRFSAVPSENLVRFNGVVAPIYSCTPFNILTSVPAGATSGAVTVTTKGIVSNGKVFTVTSAGPPPLIDSITPNVGSVEGGESVTINGSGFTLDTKVLIAQKSVASVSVIEASTLRIVTGLGVVGSCDVLVTNQNGDALLPGGFTFLSGPPLNVAGVNPRVGQTNVPINILITVLFTRPVDRATVSTSTFSLMQTGTTLPISGAFSFDFDDKILIFKPTDALKPDTSYILNINTGIKSTDGIQLDQPSNSSFTTAGFSDTVSPIVTISPDSGATGVPINTLIVLIFSEPINPTSINSSTFGVTNNGMPVSGNIGLSYQDTVVTFAPASNFLPSSFVNVALSPRVTDVAGNPIVGSGGVGTYFTSGFTTAETFDTVAPSIIAVNPPDKSTGIDNNTTVSVTFSEPVNPVTVNSGTFKISVEGAPYPGKISFSGQNRIAIFTPDLPFPYLSLITVSVAAGISDVAGNTMNTSFTNTFTTEPESILTLAYSGPTTLPIGEAISVDVSNTGDKDTTLTYNVSLSGKGAAIYQTTLTDVIEGGSTKTYGFQIPAQAAGGDYTLYAEVTNNRGKKTVGFFFIEILGANAAVTTWTDKDFYLATEPITATTTIQNGSFGIEGGSLKIAVTKMGSPATGQFSQFLPKDSWAVFKNPIGVAAVPDGSFYVADAGNFRIQKFDSTGKFNKVWGRSGSGNGQFETITCIATGPDGSVYVGDTSNWILRIQKFDRDGNFVTKWSWDGGGYLDHPFGIAVGPDGSVYVADQFNFRILKFGSNGNLILQWSGEGNGEGQFWLPEGIAAGVDGSVYVADTGNNRIQKFDNNGNFITKWGSYGESDGQFKGPFSIAIGPDGSIYVVDGKSYLGEHRIQKFDSDGNFITKWLGYGSGDGASNIAVIPSGAFYVTDTYYNRIQKFDSNGSFIAKWGNLGSAEGQFNGPYGISIGRDGSLYVADVGNHRIQKFDRSANFVLKWAGFSYPRGIAIGTDDSIFVTDTANGRIQKFDSNGNFIAKWGNSGSGDGQFDWPEGIAVGFDGLIYIADTGNNRIQVFDGNGNFIMKWGSEGGGDGQFSSPGGVATGFDGSVYVTDKDNNRIQVFDSSGNFIKKWGSEGSGGGQFISPTGIAVGADGSVFVVDFNNHRIQLFDSDGVFITKWGTKGYENGQFMWPYGVALGPDGSVYVTDAGNNRIQKLKAEILFETTIPINQPENTTQNYTTDIEALNVSGPLYLQATLLSSMGQTIGQDSYPFFQGEPLSIVSVIPGLGLNNVPINSLITVQFSKALDLTTVNNTTFSLAENVSGAPVPGSFSFDFGDRLVVFRPNNNLIPNTSYTLSITRGIKSAEGILLDQPFSSSFTTVGSADTLPPTVTISPAGGATNVPTNALIVFGFSEPMNSLTINSSTISITNNGMPVSGSITLSQQNTVGTFTPAASFVSNSVVNVTLSHKVTDLAGNPIVGSSGVGTDFMSSFSTANTVDSVPPQVLNINPTNGATGIDISTTVSVTFSESINPITTNNTSFVVSVGGTPYPGLISFSGQNAIVTFTPDQPLPTNSLVTVTLSAGISDVAGNAISPFMSTFTTYQKGPVLTIGYSGATSLTIGDTINVEVGNAGDIETTSTYIVKLNDAKGVVIYQNTIIEVIPIGASKTYSFQIPNQAADGDYVFYAEVTDSKGKKTTGSFNLKITGLSATLNTRTDKDIYAPAEAVAGLTRVMNGLYGIENGSLKVSVSRIASTAEGGFKHFLPKEGWKPFSNPGGIALGTYGYLFAVYVSDTGNHRIQIFDWNGGLITEWGSYGAGDGQFDSPSGIALDLDGFVYVADMNNHRIQKFDSHGNFVTKWGSYGSGDGQFDSPSGIAAGSQYDDSLYVLDSNNKRVQKFDREGKFITKWEGGYGGFISPSSITAAYDPGYGDTIIYVADRDGYSIQKFNSNGYMFSGWLPCDEFGMAYSPRGIAVMYDMNLSITRVYVTDGLYKLIEYDSNGNFIARFNGFYGFDSYRHDGPYGIAVSWLGDIYVADGFQHIDRFGSNGNMVNDWGGGGGTGDGKFNWPSGISVGDDNYIYVADRSNHRIQKFDRSGNFITKWGTEGSGDGQFDGPSDVAVGSNNFIYVLDTLNHRIQKFDSNGNFITKWGSYGNGDGQFAYPEGIAIGSDGFIYIVDSRNHRIQKFDSNGNFVTQWGSFGSQNGQFYYPDSVAVGPDGSVYVADTLNSRIQKFNNSGDFVTKWGDEAPGERQLYSPTGVVVSKDGFIYVLDYGISAVKKFSSDGNFIAKWAGYGTGDGGFFLPEGIAEGPDGSLYVADTGNHRIQRMIGEDATQTIYQAALSINQSANSNQDFSTNIGTLGVLGKCYLEATLLNSLGQLLGQSSYPFYVFLGDIVLFFDVDKKAYHPEETITITGKVGNRGTTDAMNLVLALNSRLIGQNSQLLHTQSFSLPPGGSLPFTLTTSASAAGIVILTGTVSLNDSILVEIKDQYEVVNP